MTALVTVGLADELGLEKGELAPAIFLAGVKLGIAMINAAAVGG